MCVRVCVVLLIRSIISTNSRAKKKEKESTHIYIYIYERQRVSRALLRHFNEIRLVIVAGKTNTCRIESV